MLAASVCPQLLDRPCAPRPLTHYHSSTDNHGAFRIFAIAAYTSCAVWNPTYASLARPHDPCTCYCVNAATLSPLRTMTFAIHFCDCRTAGLAIYVLNTSTARTGRSNKRPRDNVWTLNHPVAPATSGVRPACGIFSLAKPMSLSPPTQT